MNKNGMNCKICGNPIEEYKLMARGLGASATCEKCREMTGESVNFVCLNPATGKEECASCGTTMDDYARTGIFGCPDCYSAFWKSVLPVVRKIQGQTQHRGCIPHAVREEQYDGMRELIAKKARLQAERDRATAEGDRAAFSEIQLQLDMVEERITVRGKEE